MGKLIDLTGARYGALVVLGQEPTIYPGVTRWRVRCDCSVIKVVTGAALRGGATKTCGAHPSQLRHGHSTSTVIGPTREYQSWTAMLARCRNPRAAHYAKYGGRGITVCQRWHTFEHFLLDMGPRPPSTTIDRINNDGNYEPGNCRWADGRQQSRNRSTAKTVTLRGETMPLAECAERYALSRHLLWGRLRRGWDIERAVFAKPTRSHPGIHAGSRHPQTHLVEADIRIIRTRRASGEKLAPIAADYGITYSNVIAIVKRTTWKHVA